jgi:two-component system NtrC family sensor kinase
MVSISAAPLQLENETGYEDEVLLVLNDITEQRRQQERFQEQSRLASVGHLASGVAHEINNPLAAIHGYSELLQMANLPPKATDDAQKIQRATERAAKIVQNLLSFARKSEPEKRYLDVTSVVDQALALKFRDFELENIQVTTTHSKGIPPTMIDEQQIILVMLNILTNAEQAIKAGRRYGEIAIATRSDKGAIRISVSDDGPGIPAENLHSIFDPFFTTKEVGKGTGLGLSICYGIVRDHGGMMWAESSPGKGAAFHIELPVLPDVAPVDTQQAGADGMAVTARRILVVDDEPEVRNILGRVLSADGHDVSLASCLWPPTAETLGN